MIKFPIYPQDNEPLLKTQTPFIFTHPSVGQCLHAFFHTIHCTAEVRTLQHTRYGTDRYERHLSHAAFCWWTCTAGHFLCMTYRRRQVHSRPPKELWHFRADTRSSCFELWRSPVSHLRWQTLNACVVQWFSARLIYQAEARWTSPCFCLVRSNPRHLTNSIQETNLQ